VRSQVFVTESCYVCFRALIPSRLTLGHPAGCACTQSICGRTACCNSVVPILVFRLKGRPVSHQKKKNLSRSEAQSGREAYLEESDQKSASRWGSISRTDQDPDAFPTTQFKGDILHHPEFILSQGAIPGTFGRQLPGHIPHPLTEGFLQVPAEALGYGVQPHRDIFAGFGIGQMFLHHPNRIGQATRVRHLPRWTLEVDSEPLYRWPSSVG
jgi:hypothetical protein